MTTQPADTRGPASLPGGVTGYAGQPVTWSPSRVDDPPITAGSRSRSSPRAAQGAVARNLGETWDAGQASFTQPPGGRPARLFEAADRRHIPLRTILVTVAVVVATYLAGKLMYLLRDIVLLMLVAGFVAVLLNPAVAKVQRRVPRRGLAVTIVTAWAALVSVFGRRPGPGRVQVPVWACTRPAATALASAAWSRSVWSA